MWAKQLPVQLEDLNDPLHQTPLLRLLQINMQQIADAHKHTRGETGARTHKPSNIIVHKD